MKLLEDVTEVQKEAITHISGPLLVIAGAGSGKTRVITRRIGYLIEQGISPYNILALTFTNKASKEMKERVEQFCQAQGMWVSTFHSMCARILRMEIEKLDYTKTFTIYDKQDQLNTVKEVMKALEIDTTYWKPSKIAASIGNLKNDLVTAEESGASNASGYYEKVVSTVYKKYEETLKQNNALDFDDLLLKVVVLFKNHPDVLRFYQEKFKFILIDEYQDTNRTQYTISTLLSQRHKNICATGDPDQSIYSWRGADLRNILDFEKDFPDTKVVKLEQNYRSTKNILQAASGVISNNTMRKDKSLWTENPAGSRIKVISSYDENQEALTVAEYVQEFKLNNGIDFSGMAVFYRTNAQSRTIEGALRNNGIPYAIVGSLEFYRRKEIKDILAYLKLCVNPDDNIAFSRVINVPVRGIGKVTFERLQMWAGANSMSLLKALFRLTGKPFPGTNNDEELLTISSVEGGDSGFFKGKAKSSVKSFVETMEKLILMSNSELDDGDENAKKASVMEIVDSTITLTDFKKYLEITEKEKSGDKIENVDELVNAANEYDAGMPDGTLSDFLEGVSLIADLDKWDDQVKAVTLMTLHSAKGLEFPVVFFTGMEEGLLPHSQSIDSEFGIEEERRLCYVGITRARQELVLTHARSRFRHGERLPCIASRFIKEIPEDAIEIDTASSGIDTHTENNFFSPKYPKEFDEFDEENEYGFTPGDAVKHGKFGIGRIVEVAGSGADSKAKVKFNVGGQKVLLLKYAKLEKM